MKKIGSLLMIILVFSTAAAAAAAKGPRKFYLTKTTFAGNQTLTACATGYHMASLWEIFDPSNLKYDTTLGETSPDSGFGPTTVAGGWIRTGFANGVSGISGSVNCDAWTSDSDTNAGSVVGLNNDWAGVTPGVSLVSPWRVGTLTCDATIRVWCVQD
jgi:hypothetical protein